MRPMAHALASFAKPWRPLRFEISDGMIDHPGRKRPPLLSFLSKSSRGEVQNILIFSFWRFFA